MIRKPSTEDSRVSGQHGETCGIELTHRFDFERHPFDSSQNGIRITPLDSLAILSSPFYRKDSHMPGHPALTSRSGRERAMMAVKMLRKALLDE